MKIIIKLRHLWYGCAKFNYQWPSWKRDQRRNAKYAICTICGAKSWWMWGYKSTPADIEAQKVQGLNISFDDEYWQED